MAYEPSTPCGEYVLLEQAKYPQLKSEVLQALKDCLDDDQKLPPISDKKYLAFLHSCHFDLELAKTTIKKYYEFHYDLPQVFCELDPSAEDIRINNECLSISQMPSLNKDKRDRILYIQFKDHDHGSFVYVSFYKYLLMWMEYTLLKYGTCDGVIVVVDTKGLGWRHVVKVPIGISAKLLSFMEKSLPIRLKEIHILNTGSYTQAILKIVTKFANKDLIDKIKVHSVGSQDVFNYVPKKVMPIEIGGLGKSHIHYSDELFNDIVDIREYFLEQNEVINNHILYMNQ